MKKVTIRSILFFALYIIGINFGYAQEENSPPPRAGETKFKDKLVFGGNIGGNFGTNTQIIISPTVGYKLNEDALVGIAANYNFFSNPAFKGSIYGPSVFARYTLFEGLFAHTEYQQTFTTLEQKATGDRTTSNFPMLLVGGGYYPSIGGNTRIGVTVLFDILQDSQNYYQYPLVRGGVLMGF